MSALERFGPSGEKVGLVPLTQGLINESFQVLREGQPVFVLQRINTSVFPSPDLLMENIQRMLPYLQGQDYTALRLLPTRDGAPWLSDGGLGTWRLFEYIPGSATLARPGSGTARECGRILGRFHQLVSRAPVAGLHTPLPRFHDLAWRTAQLEAAQREGLPERIEMARPLTDLTGPLIACCRQIPFGRLPVRICHNDTKLSNILFDAASGRALCLIDLDTLMPGYLLYDVGDAARTLVSPASETDAGAEKPGIDLGAFEAFVQGLGAGGLETRGEELPWLAHGVVLMPTLHGIRALADYLTGDRYYRTAYPGQNLDRAKKLLEFAERARGRLAEMRALCLEILG